MVDDGDAFHGTLLRCCDQNTVPSLTTLIGGEPSDRRSRAIARPAAQVPPCRMLGERQGDAIGMETSAHDVRQPVEQGDRQRAPFHDERRADLVRAFGLVGVAQGQHAGVEEQAAVAIFGKARQAVDVGDRDAGRLQRLDQRVGEPLRELVQRHEAARRIGCGQAGCRQQSPSGMPPSSSREGQIGPR